MRHEQDEAEMLTKLIMGVLNKITPEKFETLCDQMMKIIRERADSEEKFKSILDSILNKASTEPCFSEQYADLFTFLSHQMPSLDFDWVQCCSEEGSPNGVSSTETITKKFRTMMILSCETRFSS